MPRPCLVLLSTPPLCPRDPAPLVHRVALQLVRLPRRADLRQPAGYATFQKPPPRRHDRPLPHGRTLLFLYCNAESGGHHRKMDLVELVAAHGEHTQLPEALST